MTAVLIIGAILLFLLFVPLALQISYEKEVAVRAGVLFPFIRVFSTEGEKKEKKQEKKPQEEKEPIDKRLLWDLIKKIPHHIKRLLTIQKLWLYIRVGNEDPADLALIYGTANAVVDTAASVLSPIYPREKWKVEILPDFDFDRLEIKGGARAYTNLWRIICVLISLLFCGILSIRNQEKEKENG